MSSSLGCDRATDATEKKRSCYFSRRPSGQAEPAPPPHYVLPEYKRALIGRCLTFQLRIQHSSSSRQNNTFVLLCPVMPASFSTCLQFIPWFMCFFFYYAELLLHFNVLSVEPLYEVLIKEPLSQLVHNVSTLQQSTGGSQSISQSCCLDEAFDSVKIIGHSIYVNFLSLQNSLTDYFLYFYDCLRTRLRQTSQRWPCSVF